MATSQKHSGLNEVKASALRRWPSIKGLYPFHKPPVLRVVLTDLDVGLDNVKKLLAHAEERGITDFGRLLAIYHRSTGLEDKLEYARGTMRFEEHLNSPQAQEDRERYWRMFGHPKELDEETAEEMEER